MNVRVRMDLARAAADRNSLFLVRQKGGLGVLIEREFRIHLDPSMCCGRR